MKKIGASSFLHHVKSRYSGSLDALDEIEECVDLIQAEKLSCVASLCLHLSELLRETNHHALAEKIVQTSARLKACDQELKSLLRETLKVVK